MQKKPKAKAKIKTLQVNMNEAEFSICKIFRKTYGIKWKRFILAAIHSYDPTKAKILFSKRAR